MTVLDGPPQIDADAAAPVAAARAVRHAASEACRVLQACPECLADTRRAKGMFCSAEHKIAFHNRQTVRGRTLTPLVMADRITRGGTRGDVATGRAARGDAQQLIDRWALEDRKLGRMSMVDYMRQRRAMGY